MKNNDFPQLRATAQKYLDYGFCDPAVYESLKLDELGHRDLDILWNFVKESQLSTLNHRYKPKNMVTLRNEILAKIGGDLINHNYDHGNINREQLELIHKHICGGSNE